MNISTVSCRKAIVALDFRWREKTTTSTSAHPSCIDGKLIGHTQHRLVYFNSIPSSSLLPSCLLAILLIIWRINVCNIWPTSRQMKYWPMLWQRRNAMNQRHSWPKCSRLLRKMPMQSNWNRSSSSNIHSMPHSHQYQLRLQQQQQQLRRLQVSCETTLQSSQSLKSYAPLLQCTLYAKKGGKIINNNCGMGEFWGNMRYLCLCVCCTLDCNLKTH